MEKVINLLAEIEEKATRIIDRSSDEKTNLYDQLVKDLEQLDTEISSDTSKKLSVLQDKMNDEVATAKQALIDDCNKQLIDMETNFSSNHDCFVENVFQNIIKV